MSYFLFCDECAEFTRSFERGWRAYLIEDAAPPDVVVLCPACVERDRGAPETVEDNEAE